MPSKRWGYWATSPPSEFFLRVNHQILGSQASVPASLDVAYPFVAGCTVVTGFADSCFAPADALRRAVDRHRSGRAAVTLAVFASDRPDKTDMVELDGERVTGFRVKPGPCELEHTFGAAVWSPEITELLHHFVQSEDAARDGELQLSEVFGAVLDAGFSIDAERSPGGRYVDVGTPEDLERFRSRGLAP
jgi:glucose-1-phosphate thymidylyltransferase